MENLAGWSCKGLPSSTSSAGKAQNVSGQGYQMSCIRRTAQYCAFMGSIRRIKCPGAEWKKGVPSDCRLATGYLD